MNRGNYGHKQGLIFPWLNHKAHIHTGDGARDWRPCSSANSLISLLWLGELHLLALSSAFSCQPRLSRNSSVTAIKQTLEGARPRGSVPPQLIETKRLGRHGLFIGFICLWWFDSLQSIRLQLAQQLASKGSRSGLAFPVGTDVRYADKHEGAMTGRKVGKTITFNICIIFSK